MRPALLGSEYARRPSRIHLGRPRVESQTAAQECVVPKSTPIHTLLVLLEADDDDNDDVMAADDIESLSLRRYAFV